MRTNVLLAAALVTVLGVGGGVLLQSDQFSSLQANRSQKADRAATVPSDASSKASDTDDNPHVVKSKARERTVELPYYVIHDTGDDLLLAERHTALRVAGSASNWRMARTALTAMENARTEGRYLNPLPDGARILGVRIDIATGIASVNLSPEARANFNGGARLEQMTIYALVNTVGRVPGVKGVTFQVAGKPIQEFAGHLDLSEPLVPDESIVEKAS